LDKFDIPIYDIPGLIKYLEDFENEAGATFNDPEAELMSELNEQIQRANDLLLEDQRYEANIIIVEESIEAIKGSDEMVKIAPTLLKDYSTYITHRPGALRYRDAKVEENIDRRNYKRADNINFLDGDPKSHVDSPNWTNFEDERTETGFMYAYPGQGESSSDFTSLINDQARVYKGASWNDRAYWMVPGTRRFLDERQSLSTLGFRCAMDRVGSPVGLGGSR